MAEIKIGMTDAGARSEHPNMSADQWESAVRENKQIRLELDGILQLVKASHRTSRERSLVRTRIEEAIMWAGMDLKALNDGRTIYPDSYDPSNTKIDSPADGLKM